MRYETLIRNDIKSVVLQLTLGIFYLNLVVMVKMDAGVVAAIAHYIKSRKYPKSYDKNAKTRCVNNLHLLL